MKENIKRLQKDEYVVLIILFEVYVTSLGRIFTDKLKDESLSLVVFAKVVMFQWFLGEELTAFQFTN